VAQLAAAYVSRLLLLLLTLAVNNTSQIDIRQIFVLGLLWHGAHVEVISLLPRPLADLFAREQGVCVLSACFA